MQGGCLVSDGGEGKNPEPEGKIRKTGIRQFSISPEGVCCVPEGKYFRRVGMLRAFPAHETKILIQYLHKDHIHAVKKENIYGYRGERSVSK